MENFLKVSAAAAAAVATINNTNKKGRKGERERKNIARNHVYGLDSEFMSISIQMIRVIYRVLCFV